MPSLLEQALGNVVHNAIRHNREGGHVAVVLEEDSACFALRVIDDGPGVPDDELGQLARRGFRGAGARERHPHGSGLGLAIAADVARRHGFHLGFARADEGGLAVSLAGPLCRSHADIGHAARSEPRMTFRQ